MTNPVTSGDGNSTQQSDHKVDAAARRCKSFDEHHHHMMSECARRIASLRDNWQSPRATAIFDEQWHKLENASMDLAETLLDMTTGLNKQRDIMAQAAQQTASIIDNVGIPNYNVGLWG
jgi:uncharacterized protein YukE